MLSSLMLKIRSLAGSCSEEEVARALTLHYRTLSPKYRAAERVAQTILDEFRDGRPREVSFRDIVLKVKEMMIPFKGADIADLAATYLHDKGIKVWH